MILVSISLPFLFQLIVVKGQDANQPVKQTTSVKLFHAFAPGNEWSPRGGLNINANDVVSIEKHVLSQEELERFRSVSSKNGLYYLKAVARNSDGKERISSTVTKACAIYESNLSEVISVSIDLNGNFLSIAVAGTNPSCISDPSFEYKRTSFNSTVVIGHQVLGPIPDTQTYIQRIEQEKSERVRGDKQDNRSFLQKYWIYIVPLVIFMIVSSATNPEAGG